MAQVIIPASMGVTGVSRPRSDREKINALQELEILRDTYACNVR